jgi:hypothetical protein
MKKMFLVACAAVLAVSFSAFTPVKTQNDFDYLNDQNQYVEVPDDINVPALCPAANVKQCKIVINDKVRLIFNPDHTPYMRD